MKLPMHAVRSIIRSVLRRGAPGLLLGGLLFFTGCVSNQDNDLPWNAPQSWENAPMLPGNFEQ